jgi:hypothetical protein
MDRDSIEYWSAEWQAVFSAIGKLIRDRPLAPGVVSSISSTLGSIVAGHQVAINYVSGKRAGPRTGHYIVKIFGPRVNAGWKFRPFELEKLSRSVDKTIGRPSQLDDDGGVLGVVGGRVRSAGTDLNDRMNSKADEVGPPPHMVGTHYDDQAERYPGQAPEDFPRGIGQGGHVNPDRPPDDELSADPEMNIVPTDGKGG